MAYEKHTWMNGEAITKAKMNHIEDGIKDASDGVSSANTAINTINNTLNNSTDGLSVRMGQLADLVNTFNSRITSASNAASSAIQAATAGTSAYQEVMAAHTPEGTQDNYESLNKRLSAMSNTTAAVSSRVSSLETARTNMSTDISNIQTEINAAHRSGVQNDSLALRFASIEGVNNEQATAINNLDTQLNTTLRDSTAQGTTYTTLDARLEASEAELVAARTNIAGYTSSGTQTFASVDARIEAIETEILNARNNKTNLDSYLDDLAEGISSATNLADTKIDKVNIRNELTVTESGYVLDARQGKALKDLITAATSAYTSADETIVAAMSALETQLTSADNALDDRIDAVSSRLTTAESDIEAIEVELGEGFSSTNTVASNISAINTALTSKASASDVEALTSALAEKASATDLSNLTTRVTTLEGKDTIVIGKASITYDETTGKPTSIGSTPTANADYLLQNADDKYYYWRYINNNWELISGGGGSSSGGGGNTSGMDLTTAQYEALEEYAVNTDYYVTDTNGRVHHYRYVSNGNTLEEIEIGTPISKKYNISIETIENEGTSINYLNLYEFDYDEDDIITDDTNIENLISKRKRHILLPATGGGGGAVNTMKITPITARNTYKAYNSNNPVYIRFFFTTGEQGEGASYNFSVDGVDILDQPVNIVSGNPANKAYVWPTEDNEELTPEAAALLGFYQFDINSYCTAMGPHTIKLTIMLDSNSAITAESNWTVTTFNLSIASVFDNNPIVDVGSNLAFTYIPTGNIEKVAHFKIDGTQIGTVPLSAKTNTTQTYLVPAQSAGAHKLEAYLTANNGAIASASIYRDIIWRDSSSSDIILASPYRGNTERMQQYDVLAIPYTVVGGTSANYTVKYYVDDFTTTVNEVSLTNTNAGQWNYRADDSGNHTLRIECGTAHIDINLVITPLNIDIAPVTNNLILDFNPEGITNTSNRRLWTNGTYHLTVSDNFDWYNGGYGNDINGDYFLVKAGTRATFDYKMFKAYNKTVNNVLTTSSTVFRDGAEMKIIFKTSAVRNASATWFTNMGPTNDTNAAKNVGIQLNVHNGWLKTDAAGDSTKSYLYFPYSEEDRIELDININPETAANAVYAMSYEDGCPSRAYPYDNTEALYQIENDESPITIGSDDCDVYIYRIRIYNAALNTEDVLRNFIADGKDTNERRERYERNSIYYDTQNNEYTPYQGQDIILDPERLAKKIPDVKILMLDTPRFTTSKKDFVANSTLRCIHAEGGKVYPSRGKEDNWLFGNGYHAGQGTTSDKYGDAGRNVDFLFECDGIHNPSDKVKPGEGFIPGYQSYVIKGYGMQDSQGHSLAEDPQYCLDWKDEDTWKANTAYAVDDLVRANGQVYKCETAHTSDGTFSDTNWTLLEGYSNKISLTSTSIPNNFFNLKVNIASSENVNNALFQKRYNDFLIDLYQSLAYQRDNRIKNDMEFVPAILFLRENDTEHTDETYTDTKTGEIKTKRTYTNHNEFNDTEWHFYALGNIGDSKKTDYTRAYDSTDMNEFTLEISDNNTNNSQFQSGVYMKNGVRTVEGYTVEQDYDEEKQKYKDTYSAMSSETDITIETTDYLFPIDYATEWAAVNGNGDPINMRYWSLMNEKFDGDHSFEMRYACEGNYRDGKLVNDTHGNSTVSDGKGGYLTNDKYQLELNSNVWREFYTWLVTCSDEQFVNELELWCVKRSVAFFYAFTHYYTMIDNRAKNTFWHFAKTGTRRAVPIGRAVPNLMHIYEESDGNGGYQAASGNFDNTKQYYTQYAFDMWVYDCDTAIGIDNNGELIFPYGKEDTDYREDNDPSSGPVFNGAGSIFWTRLRQNFSGDITTAFTGVSNECFNATNLINQFDKFQNCYPESIWRLDVERKYIRSFTGDDGATEDNPQQAVYLTRKNTRFLGDMMQGRKKYQRRQWVKDQGVYFGSKYMLSNMNNQFDMVCYTIGGQNVLPNWDLTITPYQDMYINVDYGETAIRGRRAKAGIPIEVKCPFTSMNESRIRIYGADYIQALAGKPIKDEHDNIIGAESLASLYFRGNDFNHTNKLRELIIGSPDTTYNNSQFNTLNLNPNSPILEVLDIQNCSGLTGTLSLSGATALKRIEAQGTSLTSINLPSSTGIETLHLPSTVNSIILTSAKKLSGITIKTRAGVDNVDNLTTLIVNDSDYSNLINWVSIANQALSHLTNLQLLELNHSSIVNIDAMEPFKVRKETLGNMTNESGEEVSRVNLTGTIIVTGDWSAVEKTNYETVWPYLTLDVSQGTQVNKTKVTYMNRSYISDTGIVPESEIMSTYITAGNIISDIYAGYAPADLPKRDPTIENVFQFGSLTQLGAYRIYSGWTLDRNGTNPLPLSNDYNNNNPYRAEANTEEVTLYTLFNATKHEYTVNWYLEPGKLVKSVTQQQYGGGYELQAPTVSEVKALYDTATCTFNSNNTVTYSIFDGWEKLPTNITPTLADAQTSTYNIYGRWHTNTISIDDNAENGLFNDTTNPSLEQLWVLSKMSSTNRNSHTKSKTIVKNKKFNYEMGYNGIVNGTTFVTTDQAQIFDEDSIISSSDSIKPFSTNNGFTLAIDYQLNSEQPEATNGQILVGCYDKVNGSVVGFALYNNMNENYGRVGPVVGYGNMFSNNQTNVAVGPTGCRNMVVIRHPANSSTLWIYSSRNTNSISLDNNITINQISLATQVLSENAVLCLGHLRSDIFTNNTFTSESINTTGAYGTIYWGKYWSEDLGDGECRQLANWPHEKMTSIITSINDDYPTERLTPTIYLTNLNGSSHGIAQCNRFSSSGEGWATSNLKSICDNRIFNGLPIRMQSILNTTRVGYRNYTITTSTDDYGVQTINYSLSELDSAQGYVYLPSISSLTKNSVDQYKIESLLERNHIATGSNLNQEITPYTWHNDSASMLVYDYDISTTGYWKLQDGINSNYYNLRFANKPISWSTSSKLRIYRINRNSIQSNTTLFDLLASQNIHSGDIVILTNDAAYMYVSSADLAEGLYTEPQENIFNTQDTGGSYRGSWIRSQSYVTRSTSASQSTYNNFIYINALGSPIVPDNSGNQPGYINLNYAFTI